jgi:serine kinase of HPr protein (carbohydrate metabolism regulator)
MARSLAVHATALVIGESGILIRGEPGTGKSSLALDLIATSTRDGRFARLIGDDRLMLTSAGGRLIARPHPAVAGLIERRGLGLTPIEAIPAALIRFVVDLTADAVPRLPEPETMVTTLAGVTLPRLLLGPGAERSSHVLAALELFDLP